MINESLEADLQEYAKNTCGKLFEEKLYLPLTYLAKAICTKRRIPAHEYEDKVADMVSHVSVKLSEYYNENKGTAKNAVYILMDQYLLQTLQKSNAFKRNTNKTVYIEDSAKFTGLLEVQIDEVEYLKALLKDKKKIFSKINNALHCKIAGKIIECIENPDKYENINNSYILDISRKAECKVYQVHSTLKKMQIMLLKDKRLSILHSKLGIA